MMTMSLFATRGSKATEQKPTDPKITLKNAKSHVCTVESGQSLGNLTYSITHTCLLQIIFTTEEMLPKE